VKRVKDHKFLYDRQGAYYFRRAVPEEAQHAFGGKTEVVVSLGTRSLAQARHLANERLREFDKALSAARGTPDPTARIVTVAKPAAIPDRQEIESAVRGWLKERLSAGLPDMVFLRPDLAQERASELSAQQVFAAARLKPGSTVSDLTTSWVAEDIAQRHGWHIERGDPEWAALQRLIDRATREQAHQQLADLNGEPVQVLDTTFSPEKYRLDEERRRERVARPKAHLSITGLLDRYVVEAGVSPATEKQWRRMLRHLRDFLGRDDAHAVTTSDLIRWKEHLLLETSDAGKQRSVRTVREGYIAAVKAVFNWAAQNDLLRENPAEKVKVLGGGRRQHLRSDPGFSNDEALTVLRATLKPPPPRMTVEMARARRWVPWLCAYTGARVGEMSQLRAEDVKLADGHWIVHITPEAGSVKDGRARDVPLHPHLIEQGFIEVVEKLEGPLFYSPSRHRGGKDGNPQYKKVGERLAAWVRELGVDDPHLQPNHAWRHRFKKQSRRSKFHPDTANAIQGHRPRTDSEGYGEYGDLEAMVEAIERFPRYEV
jgi:integrase